MTELERLIHDAVDKAFREYIESQGRTQVYNIFPETLERNAKYQELWDRAIMKALENMSKEK